MFSTQLETAKLFVASAIKTIVVPALKRAHEKRNTH
jgi:hypothetical protein